jgi:hypothetical protein
MKVMAKYHSMVKIFGGFEVKLHSLLSFGQDKRSVYLLSKAILPLGRKPFLEVA